MKATQKTLIVITVIAAALRLYSLTSKSIWIDEAYSVELARLGWRDFCAVIAHQESNMVAYYLLLRLWVLFGHGEAYVRVLSVLFSVATIPVIYLLGTRLFGQRAGLIAGGLLAINAYHVRYAQETRSYAMVTFLVVLATWILVRNIQGPEYAHWRAYAILCALAVYTHLFAVLFIAAHLTALLLLRLPKPKYIVPLGLAIIPFGLFTASNAIPWVPKADARAFYSFFVSIAGNGGPSLLVIETLAVVLGGCAAWRLRPRWPYALVFCWAFLPVLFLFGLCLLRPCFLGRYLNPSVPALVLLIAVGIAELERIPATLLGAAILAGSLLGTSAYYQRDFDLYRGNWREVSSFILDKTQPGDDLFYVTFFGAPLEFYKGLRSSNYPQSIAPTRDLLLKRSVAEEISDSRTPGKRIWLVLDDRQSTTNEMLRAYFSKGRQTLEERSFEDHTETILLSQ